MNRWSSTTTRGNSAWWLSVVVLLTGPAAVQGSEESAEPAPTSAITIAAPIGHPVVGERLSFHGHWFGIPVGLGWIEVKGLEDLDGRKVYHIEAQGQTNDVLSTLYPIHDVVHSFIDAETLQPLRFEKHQREGHYRSDEVVTFNPSTRRAAYRSLLNQSTKDVDLPDQFQDLISALYWFRRQPITPESTMQVNLYTDEKIYETTLLIKPPMTLELLKRGTFPCLVVEPKASFKGLLVKRGRIWAYLTTDARRLPLLVKATTPWGAMSAVLDEESLLPPSTTTVTPQ